MFLVHTYAVPGKLTTNSAFVHMSNVNGDIHKPISRAIWTFASGLSFLYSLWRVFNASLEVSYLLTKFPALMDSLLSSGVQHVLSLTSICLNVIKITS